MSATIDYTGRVTTSAGSGAAGAIVTALLVAAAAFYFQEGFDALFTAWMTPEYSHGPLIPLLSGFLFLRDFRALPERPGPLDDRWPGVLVVALSIALGALGKVARIDDIVAYALIVFVAGFMLTTLGWARGRRCWPAILHLVFMLPLPATLYWKVSTSLQFISSELGVYFIRLAGVPVFLEGNIIDLGVYKLHVAEACSGLRYLYPILSFSYIFAALYRGPTWHKAVLLISAAPITVFMNSVRIGIIGIVVDRVGMSHVEGLTHLLEGWVIFVTAVLILFGMARAMLALQPAPRMGLAEALDLDFEGLRPQLARVRHVRASAAMLVALGIVGGVAVAWKAAPPRAQPAIERMPFALFPVELGAWRRQSVAVLEPQVEAALGADDYFSATYLGEAGGPYVDVFFAWYRDQTQGGIHSPEVCLPGAGWEMASIRRIDRARPGEAPFPINRAVIQKGEQRLLVYYWFEQYGGRTAWDYAAKAALLRDALLHGRSDGALARFITPILPGETEQQAEARLASILDSALEAMPRFLPRLER